MQEILVEVQQKNGTIGFNFDEIKKALKVAFINSIVPFL